AIDKEESLIDKEKQENIEKRIFLHLLSILQREGRLIDFLAEDLSTYEDEQIGAAVRDVHEKCKKIIDKYVPSQPILNQDEGDEITVEKGFDAEQIKLIGNVTGEPPFKGVLRHKGWRAKKLNLPTLSNIKDSTIIAPAEVEIL
ncbi:MAG: DUF2760 domain-containing protein, partial [Desulfobacterales bacterium]|nr:DUF2760 domain-containing protein [Desulfobacterales bacterium]